MSEEKKNAGWKDTVAALLGAWLLFPPVVHSSGGWSRDWEFIFTTNGSIHRGTWAIELLMLGAFWAFATKQRFAIKMLGLFFLIVLVLFGQNLGSWGDVPLEVPWRHQP